MTSSSFISIPSSSIVGSPMMSTQYTIIMKIVVLLLAALVLCQAASIKELLATRLEEEQSQEAAIQDCFKKEDPIAISLCLFPLGTPMCLPDMKGNGVCDAPCDKATYNYDEGDCCASRGFRYNGIACVAKKNGFDDY